MNIFEIIKSGLEANGYDGLYNNDADEPCGCLKDDLSPCGCLENSLGCCQPGYNNEAVAKEKGCYFWITPVKPNRLHERTEWARSEENVREGTQIEDDVYRQEKQKQAAHSGTSRCNGCAVPVLGQPGVCLPIGELRLTADAAKHVAEIAYQLGDGFTLWPVVRVENNMPTLIAVQFQHNASNERLDFQKGE